jgi:hypothetical protein
MGFMIATLLFQYVWVGKSSLVTPSPSTQPERKQFPSPSLFLASSYQEVDLFSEIRGPDFNAAFGNKAPSSSAGSGGTNISLNQYTMGDILTPQAVGQHATVKEDVMPKGLTTDVDSSLAMAAANLSMLSPQDNSSDPWAGKPVCRVEGAS